MNSPHSTSVPTITVVNPSGKGEVVINATDLELWRAKGYRLHSETGTPQPQPRPTPQTPREPKAGA